MLASREQSVLLDASEDAFTLAFARERDQRVALIERIACDPSLLSRDAKHASCHRQLAVHGRERSLRAVPRRRLKSLQPKRAQVGVAHFADAPAAELRRYGSEIDFRGAK